MPRSALFNLEGAIWNSSRFVLSSCEVAEASTNFEGRLAGIGDDVSILGPYETQCNGVASVALALRVFDDTHSQDRGRGDHRQRPHHAGESRSGERYSYPRYAHRCHS